MTAVLQPTFEGDFTFAVDAPFALEAGGALQPVTLHYALYGALNERRDNAILVCHALSGSARVADWWPQVFAPEGPFDARQFCVIGVNVIGSCYGSTGPASVDPQTGEPYGSRFPLVTIGDMVRAQAELMDHLGVGALRLVVGGSIGGMQAIHWAVDFPDRVEACVAIGAAPLSAMGLALNHLQRRAIRNDPAWSGGRYAGGQAPVGGLAIARGIAMCSYKSAELFAERFARRPNRGGEDPYTAPEGRFDIGGYLDYQGEIFTRRFDANAYIVISKAMDAFDLGHSYGSEERALERIRARTLLVGITSDWLFPAADVRALADRMRASGIECKYEELFSAHGHDGFLADAAHLTPLLAAACDERAWRAQFAGDPRGRG